MKNTFTKILKRLPAALGYYSKVKDLNLAIELASLKEETKDKSCTEIQRNYNVTCMYLSYIDHGSERDTKFKRRYLHSLLPEEGKQEFIEKSVSIANMEEGDKERFLYSRPLERLAKDAIEFLQVILLIPVGLVALLTFVLPICLIFKLKFGLSGDATCRALEFFFKALFGQLKDGDDYSIDWVMYNDVERTPKVWVSILRIVITAVPYRNRAKAISGFRSAYRKWKDVANRTIDPFKENVTN